MLSRYRYVNAILSSPLIAGEAEDGSAPLQRLLLFLIIPGRGPKRGVGCSMAGCYIQVAMSDVCISLHFSIARVLTSSEWQFSTVNGGSQERQSAPQPYPTAA